MATAYSNTKVTLLFTRGDTHKFSFSKVVPGRADWLGCMGCTSLYIVIDQDLSRFAAIGSIDMDFAPEGSARIKLWFKDGETLTLWASQITCITKGLPATRYRWPTDK